MAQTIPLNGNGARIVRRTCYPRSGKMVESARADSREGVLRSQLNISPEGHCHIRSAYFQLSPSLRLMRAQLQIWRCWMMYNRLLEAFQNFALSCVCNAPFSHLQLPGRPGGCLCSDTLYCNRPHLASCALLQSPRALHSSGCWTLTHAWGAAQVSAGGALRGRLPQAH